jgi:3-deoxy-D-manno-octulosonate 8-phosphate phosphatase (KDO 8-P phosphatase)
MSALNVKYIVQGEENKLPALKTMAKQLKLSLEEIAYIGDDMPDYECINAVGLGIAVQDAHPSILSIANYTTFNHGGFGAVREICDLIMLSQNTLANASGASI